MDAATYTARPHPVSWDNPGPTTDVGMSGSNLFITVRDEDAAGIMEWLRSLSFTLPTAGNGDVALTEKVRAELAQQGHRPVSDTGPGGQVRYNLSGLQGVLTSDPGNGIRFIAAGALAAAGYDADGTQAHLSPAPSAVPVAAIAKQSLDKTGDFLESRRGKAVAGLVAVGAALLAIGAAVLRRR